MSSISNFRFTAIKDSWILTVFLILISLSISFLVARVSIIISPLIIIGVLGIGFTALILYDFRVAFYAGIVLTSTMFYLERVIPVAIPYGVLTDLLFLMSFISLLFNRRYQTWKSFLGHPITLGYLVIFIFQIFQVFNPNAVSLTPWLLSLRTLIFPLVLLTALALADDVSNIKMLLKIWIGIAFFAAVYAIYQEIFGLTGFEMNWVTADPVRFGLYYIMGHMRKFSFLSDPSAFGVFMAYSALASFCFIFSPVSLTKKLLLSLAFVLMIFAMLYSGTRTAYAMLIIGVVFFTLITIRKKTTFIAAFLLIMGFLMIMFGPFYNRYVNRLRTAFRPSEDASMEVRDVKRVMWQPYILNHPMGGGINTTGSTGVKYSAGHELAGGWDPDSGYLRVALEQGWIGFILLMSFFFMVMVKGIDNYFRLHDPMLQSINLAFLVPFFAVTVGNFTQNAVLYKPLYLFVIATYSVLICIPKLDK